jgi:hypothetical protein
MRASVFGALIGAGLVMLIELGVRGTALWSVAAPEPSSTTLEEREAVQLVEVSEPTNTQVSYERRGRAPRLGLRRLQREGTCGITADIHPLRALTDPMLIAQGLGAVSPIEASLGGAPLPVLQEQTDDCAGSARFVGRVLHVEAPGPDPAPDPEQLSLSLSEALPLQTPEGPVWWVYPRTSLDWVLPKGAVSVSVTARTVAGSGGTATLHVLDAAAPLASAGGDRVTATVKATTSGNALRVSVEAPIEAPFLVIESLTATTGEASFALQLTP